LDDGARAGAERQELNGFTVGVAGIFGKLKGRMLTGGVWIEAVAVNGYGNDR
jgi:hypothetical protein